ncbi:MAG: Cna B-type domain-containing protein, partial [Lachnospiraceae bacterium]|nr:Cna B-type domain-containing protein [Lachnospiraceae bacterium]
MAMVFQQAEITTLAEALSADDATEIITETTDAESNEGTAAGTEEIGAAGQSNGADESTDPDAQDASADETLPDEEEEAGAAEDAETESETAQTEDAAETDSEAAEDESEDVSEDETEDATEAESETDDADAAEDETAESVTEAAEDETESETESETETEAYKTYFTYSDSQVIVTAIASESANLPADAELRADYIAPNSAVYKAAVSKIESQLGDVLGLDNVEAAYVIYDVYFVSAGERVEPENGTVSVQMMFQQSVDLGLSGEITSSEVIHIKESGEAELVTDYVGVSQDGTLKSMGFTQESFSLNITFLGSSSITYSSSLNDFVTSATISPANYDGGNIILQPGESYTISLSFSEDNSIQLDNSAESFVYTFPNGFSISEGTTGGDIIVTGKDSNGNTVTVNGTYTVSGNQIIITIDKTQDSWSKMQEASDVSFSVNVTAKASASSGEATIEWGHSITTPVVYEDSATISISKTGTYNKTTGTMDYTVTITSKGTSKNVEVTDSITGTLLTYDATSFSSSISTGTCQTNGNGFTYTIPSMSDGETVTIKYSATIDYTKLTDAQKAGTSTVFTVDQTKNTLSAEGDNTNTPSDVTHSFENTTIYDLTPSKSGELKGSVSSDGKQTIEWTITVNSDCIIPVGGSTVTDTLVSNPNVPVSYSGTGITVTKYTKNSDGTYTQVSSETIAWGSSELTKTNTSWTYTIPATDTTAYKYVITYTTVADVSTTIQDETVENKVSFKDKETTGSQTLPANNDYSVSKTHTGAVTTDLVTFNVEVTIPECGISNSLVIEDDIPSNWVSSVWYYDSYIDGSLTITLKNNDTNETKTLTKGTDYEVTYTPSTGAGHSYDKVVITFKNVTTLFPQTTNGMTLTLTYKINPSDTWPYGETHTNTVYVWADNVEKSDTDTFQVTKAEVEKVLDSTGTTTTTENGSTVTLPTYRFIIYVGGVSGNFTVTDTFDTALFEYFETTDQWKTVQVGAGTNQNDAKNGANGSSNGGTVTASVDSQTGTLTFSVIPAMNGSSYYSWYCITYNLKVKDAAALAMIKAAAAAAGGTVTYTNTASWNGSSDEATYTYTLSPISKTQSTDAVDVDNGFKASFTITINEDCLALNGGSNYTLTDTLTATNADSSSTAKLQLVVSSVTAVVYDSSGNVVNISCPFSYADDLQSFTMTIPDGYKVVVTYDAKVVGSGSISYSNTAAISGYQSVSTETKTVSISSSAQGSFSDRSITVVKKDSDTHEALSATFDLYVLNNGTYERVQKYVNHMSASDRTTSGDYKKENVSIKTDVNGTCVLTGSLEYDGWQLAIGSTYKLVETSAPNGYSSGSEYIFTIVNAVTGTTDGNGATQLAYGDEYLIYNTKNTTDTGSLSITKTVNGTITDDKTSYKVTVTANAGNSNTDLSSIYVKYSNGIALSSTAGGLDTSNSATGIISFNIADKDTVVLSALPYGSYTVTEESTSGQHFVTTYKVGSGSAVTGSSTTITLDSQTTAQTVAFANTYTSLTVTKKVTVNGAEDKLTAAKNFKVALFTDASGVSTSKVSGSEQTITVLAGSGSASYTYYGLALDTTYYVFELNDAGNAITSGNTTTDGYTVSYTYGTNGTDTSVALNGSNLTGQTTVTNATTTNATGTLNVTKNVVGAVTDSSSYYTVTVEAASDNTNKNLSSVKVTVGTAAGSELTGNNLTMTDSTSGIITFRITDSQTIVLSGLPYGKYIVTETGAYTSTGADATSGGSDQRFVTTYTVGSATESTADKADAAINSATAVDVTIYNTYTSLTVNKEVKQNGTIDTTAKESFTVALYKDKGTTMIAGTVKTISLTAGTGKGSVTYYGLEPGTYYVYEVCEDDTTPGSYVPVGTGFAYSVSGSGDAVVIGTTSGATLTPSVTITNDLLTGSLQVKKVVAGDTNQTNTNGYVVTVTASNTSAELSKVTATSDKNGDITGSIDVTNNKITFTVKSDETVTFSNLPLDTYTVKETSTGSVETTYEVDGTTGAEVTIDNSNYDNTNTTPQLVTITNIYTALEVSKTVSGATATSGGYEVTVTSSTGENLSNVVVNGTTVDSSVLSGDKQTITLKVENGETVKLTNLPIGTYTVTETTENKSDQTGYTLKTTYTVDGTKVDENKTAEAALTKDNGYTGAVVIANNYTAETTEITVTKKWEDADNQDGIRPEFVKITLYQTANGKTTEYDIVTLSEEKNWTATWSSLPVKDSSGNAITYSVDETDVPSGYTKNVSDGTATANGASYIITNTYTPETTEVQVTKVWSDNNNQDGIRADSVTVKLFANGADTGKTVKLDENNNWTANFTDLAKYESGNEIAYTVVEVSVPNGYYTSAATGSAADGYTITNTHTPETITITGSKTWVDDTASTRPESITIHLYADGKEVDSKTVAADNNWNWTFSGLDKYSNGVEIKYTITEDAVAGYTTKINGYNVTNTYVPVEEESESESESEIETETETELQTESETTVETETESETETETKTETYSVKISKVDATTEEEL